MNLTWHIVKKDLRALKWPLLLWALLIVAKLLIGVAMLTAKATTNLDWLATSFSRLAVFSQLLAALEGVSFVLVAAIVHEDLLVGTTAFWLTRPISGARLLRAKLLGIGIMFGLVPVLITLPWWLGCGYGIHEIAWAAGELLAVQAAFALAGLLWSVVTDGFARFLMWTLATLFAFPSIAAMVGLYLTNHKVEVKPDLMLTRMFVEVATAVIVILAVTVHQFLTRHTWRSVVFVISGASLIVLTALWWPWDWQLREKLDTWQAQRLAGRSMRVPEPAGLKFTAQPPTLVSERSPRLRMNIQVEGTPAGRSLVPYNGEYFLRWRDDTSEHGWGMVRNTGRSLPGDVPEDFSDNRQSLVLDLRLTTERLARIRAEPPVFTPRVYLRMMKAVGAEKVAAQPGDSREAGAYSERVAGVETQMAGMMLALVNRSPAIWPASPDTDGQLYSQYRLANRPRGEALHGRQLQSLEARVATVLIKLSLTGYDAPNAPYASQPANKMTKAQRQAAVAAALTWMRDAELYCETYTEELRFMHEFRIDPLVIEQP